MNRTIKNAGYYLYDLLTLKKGRSRKINDMDIRFPVRWSRYFPSAYEADNYSFIRRHVKEGSEVIDIGAHIGLFSVYCSRLAGTSGKIISFEPTPGTFSIMQETLRLNKCSNVIPMQAAVGASPGKATFYVSNEHEGCNANSLVKNRNNAQGYDIDMRSIDSICREEGMKPRLIKIDAEGAELDVLKGGLETFQNVKPLVILGLHPAFIKSKGDSLSGIWDLVKSCNYKMLYNEKEMTESEFISQADLFDVQLIPA